MNEAKIVEIATQFDDDSPEFAMSQQAVIAFARALIKEERTRVNQIIDDGYRQGGHLKWLCAIAIVERIKEEEE